LPTGPCNATASLQPQRERLKRSANALGHRQDMDEIDCLVARLSSHLEKVLPARTTQLVAHQEQPSILRYHCRSAAACYNLSLHMLQMSIPVQSYKKRTSATFNCTGASPSHVGKMSDGHLTRDVQARSHQTGPILLSQIL